MDGPRVIIIGGGFAGLNAAKALKSAPFQVLLIDKANYHLFQPLLYQVASAALSPGDIASPIRDVLARQENASVLLADIVSIDLNQKQVVSDNGERFAYDYLILAPGSNHSYFGHPEWEKLAPGLKTIFDALRIRERILLSYERAERCGNAIEATRFMRFVIIGAGPTGVEMAGAIAEIANKALVRNFRHIKPEQTKIYLIEGGPRVLPSYPEELSTKAQRALEKLGVEVWLNSFVTKVIPDGIWMGDILIESPNVIWAAGNEAPPLLQSLGTPLDKAGRAIVNPDLSLAGHPEVFVIGDAASCKDASGQPLPGIAPVAIQQGKYVARLLKNVSAMRTPFHYRDKGMMATIGKAKAVAVIGKIKISGYFAWLAWCFIHVMYLISFASKLQVMFEWFYLYILNKRRIRLITRPITDQDDPFKK